MNIKNNNLTMKLNFEIRNDKQMYNITANDSLYNIFHRKIMDFVEII